MDHSDNGSLKCSRKLVRLELEEYTQRVVEEKSRKLEELSTKIVYYSKSFLLDDFSTEISFY